MLEHAGPSTSSVRTLEILFYSLTFGDESPFNTGYCNDPLGHFPYLCLFPLFDLLHSCPKVIYDLLGPTVWLPGSSFDFWSQFLVLKSSLVLNGHRAKTSVKQSRMQISTLPVDPKYQFKSR